MDSQALADALNNGYLAGAGIDVFETEPPLDVAHPLLHSKNTIVTPMLLLLRRNLWSRARRLSLTTSFLS